MTSTARRNLLLATLAAATLAAAPAAFAQSGPRVLVTGAWVRASVAGQNATGAFMNLTAREPMQLVGASSPAAGVAEVHEMKMDGSVMRMRAVPSIELPAGRAVELKPGGYHLMLMDLKKPLAAGDMVPVTLAFRDKAGMTVNLEFQVPVALTAPAGAPAPAHKH
jgi:copper(I)-binding protein